MKLQTVQITNFRSVRDSGEFKIEGITCLVGKNEAGKTGVLEALHRLNPLDTPPPTFSVTDDYPRSDVSEYEQDVSTGSRMPAHVVTAKFELDPEERRRIEQDFGAGVLLSTTLKLQRGYYDGVHATLEIDESAGCKHLVDLAELPAPLAAAFAQCKTLDELQTTLESVTEDEHTKRLEAQISKIKNAKGFSLAAYETHLEGRVPKFLYFDEFYQMRGHENLDALKQRLLKNQLYRSDHPLLGLVALANLTLDQLLNPPRTLDLKNRLEGAGNKLSRTILKYWSQNKHIQMRFDVRPGRPGDPSDMRTGTNLWAEVYDSKHLATTGVGERSRGFVWFFSFLAWYAEQQKTGNPIILLLDEPGLTLHGAAQEDLLRYIEEELSEQHQVIYSTHSPFMVDPRHLERVRIVQDRGMEQDDVPPDEDGTKVFDDVLRASSGSLFPLHGALGFEIQQTLFVGPYTLIVEGVSDLLYIQTMSGVLERRRRTGLSAKWVVAPVGGLDKVPAFAALFGAQRTMTVATLVDLQKKDVQTVENLYKQKLLEQRNVLTYAQFVHATEADAEDMFGDEFYLTLVNGEFAAHLEVALSLATLPPGGPRVLSRIERSFEGRPLKNGVTFNHYRPARYLAEHIATLEARLPAETLDRFEAAFIKLNALR